MVYVCSTPRVLPNLYFAGKRRIDVVAANQRSQPHTVRIRERERIPLSPLPLASPPHATTDRQPAYATRCIAKQGKRWEEAQGPKNAGADLIDALPSHALSVGPHYPSRKQGARGRDAAADPQASSTP
nr:hypothetical protein Iba_scaffold15947CG0030 [Ipomoea batatas]